MSCDVLTRSRVERANSYPFISNPRGLKYVRLFDSSGDQELFLRREDLERDGWELGRDMIFRRKRSPQTNDTHMLLFDKPSEIDAQRMGSHLHI